MQKQHKAPECGQTKLNSCPGAQDSWSHKVTRRTQPRQQKPGREVAEPAVCEVTAQLTVREHKRPPSLALHSSHWPSSLPVKWEGWTERELTIPALNCISFSKETGRAAVCSEL